MGDQDDGIEKIGKLEINHFAPKPLKGYYAKVFAGVYEGKKKVSVKRVEKSETEVDTNAYLTACDHPNLVQYFCIEENHREFRYIRNICPKLSFQIIFNLKSFVIGFLSVI